jgi:argininosuccinate lyase
MAKLWKKTTGENANDLARKVEAFTVGNDYILDQKLVPYDLAASAVHAEALKIAGIISDDDFRQLTLGLNDINRAWEEGTFRIRPEDEDMHTAIENKLTEKLGDLGKKIHAGRSRNDQVLTAVRLYEKEKLNDVIKSVIETAESMILFAEKYEAVPMPGFTHTRKAMLSSVGLWAGGYAELLIMQAKASDGVRTLIDRSPLGTAAGFGTTFSINRELEAEKLGFGKPMICATTAQLSRGWIELQLVQYLSALGSIINRLASDVIHYSSEAYGFFHLDESVCTGSSIMPQKQNPDLAELMRARSSKMVSHAAALQTLVVNLGSGYHRDLQLTKEPVIQAFEEVLELLEAARWLLSSIKPIEENLKNACTPELFAAEAANRLVKNEGKSFREAYRIIKENQEAIQTQSPEEMLKEYSHLGSPGNPGLGILMSELKNLHK